jgi:uncharacterized repeat protein (TIGR03803 family)
MKINNYSNRRAGRQFGKAYMNTTKKPNTMKMKLFCFTIGAIAMTAAHLTAQTFTILHSFTGGSDGAYPVGGLVLSGNTLFGAADSGGSSGHGTLFAVKTNGTGFTTLHSFTATIGTIGGYGTNRDGIYPWGRLILSGNTLYGTTAVGGSNGSGTVFAVHTNGFGFTTLYSFTTGSGAYPFTTNSDGAYPVWALVLSGDTLYGTATSGGSSGNGTVFALNTDGTGFTNLWSFTGGSDGGYPWGGLVSSGNTLYGTAPKGGSWGNGTVFALNTDGTDFTNLYSFTATVGIEGTYGTNSDGAYPLDGLVLSGNTLYGTANIGGTNGYGTVFALDTDGTGFTNLHSFTQPLGTISNYGTNSDGAYPRAGLMLSGNTLYGTANSGGTGGSGTLFSLTLPAPQLTITTSDTNVILTWPTNAAGISFAGYTLQSTTNLVSTAVWTPAVPGPVIANGQFTVSNAITGTQQFYQLRQ